jgi:hypothetical protein
MRTFLILPVVILALILIQCGRVGKLNTGKYEIADQEYSSQNYVMERLFEPQGGFLETHILERCLLMEMRGTWLQDGGKLTLRYSEMRNRNSCRDSLPAFAKDSAELKIPVRNVDRGSFESFLAASEGKPDKWIKWLRRDDG